MLKINRDSRTENKLEKAHYLGLKDFVRSRLDFALLAIGSIGKSDFTKIINEADDEIPTETKTSLLNHIIGNNTSYTKRDEWGLFLINSNINPNVLKYRKDLLQILGKLTDDKIKKILIAKPNALLSLEKAYYNSLPKRNGKEIKGILDSILEYIFEYDYLAKKGNHYNAFKLITTSDIHSCPYCNLNPVVTNKVEISDVDYQQGLRSELDHYFPKNEHVLLGLSFYNLIPSCLPCNLRLKGKTPFDLERFLHPYIIGFDIEKGGNEKDRVSFLYEFNNGIPPQSSIVDLKEEDIKIRIYIDKSINKKKELMLLNMPGDTSKKGSITVFELEQSYNNIDVKSKAISFLYNVQNKINSNYVQSLSWFYNEMNDAFTKVYKLELAVYWNEKDHTKALFSKLARDLYVQELKNIGVIIK